MVVFCIKTEERLTFRKPVEADFLGSTARRYYMLPEHEIDLRVFERNDGSGGEGILSVKTMAKLEKWHQESAIGHWEVMRTVLPAVVWEQW